MPELKDLLKAVRRKAELTQAELAARLGLAQNTISQYESGSAAPSDSTLVRLYAIAIPGPEKEALQTWILSQFGYVPPELQKELLRETQVKQLVRAAPALAGVGWKRLQQEFLKLVESVPSVDSSLVELVRLYRKHRDNPHLRQVFRDIAVQAEYRLEVKPAAESKVQEITARRRKKRKSAS